MVWLSMIQIEFIHDKFWRHKLRHTIMVLNSLAPGTFQINFRWVIFKLTLVNGHLGISYEIALRWMPLDLTDEKSTLVQVMAWCRQATSHYLSQCWPRSMSSEGNFTKNNLSHQLLKWAWKLLCLKFHTNLLGASELTHWPLGDFNLILGR